MWYKGLNHYHTQFKYPKNSRITAKDLSRKLIENKFYFCFCAGDHGDNNGKRQSWGMLPSEYFEYKDYCISANGYGAVLIPAPEIHLRFNPFAERHEHHSCICIDSYQPEILPEVFDHQSMQIYKINSLIDELHKYEETLILNHPFLSQIIPAFAGPNPLHEDSLYKMDYFEIFTEQHPDYFSKDFECYLQFLSHPDSFAMGCCGGVDRIDVSMYTEVPATYLFIEGELNRKNILRSWKSKKTYAVFGNISIAEIFPIPSCSIIKTGQKPEIFLQSSSYLTIFEIYRNGKVIYREKTDNKNIFTIKWHDDSPLNGRNSYVLHMKSNTGILVTSPIHFFCV